MRGRPAWTSEGRRASPRKANVTGPEAWNGDGEGSERGPHASGAALGRRSGRGVVVEPRTGQERLLADLPAQEIGEEQQLELELAENLDPHRAAEQSARDPGHLARP